MDDAALSSSQYFMLKSLQSITNPLKLSILMQVTLRGRTLHNADTKISLLFTFPVIVKWSARTQTLMYCTKLE